MAYLTDSAHRFDAQRSADPAKTALELVCCECGQVVCDIADRTNLAALLQVSDDHACPDEDALDEDALDARSGVDAAAPVEDRGVEVTVTRSSGTDGAVVVFVDTDFEPDASDGGPGLRVHVNDAEVYAGPAYVAGPAERPAAAITHTTALSDLTYLQES